MASILGIVKVSSLLDISWFWVLAPIWIPSLLVFSGYAAVILALNKK